MREKADQDGFDILLIDTGDRVEGNGLYDASEPKGVYTNDIFKEQAIDIICSGNHELYKQHTSENEYLVTVPNFKGNYLASNIDIIDPATKELVPLAQRFKKFTTKNQEIRILAFGFLFDFTGNANNTVVQSVKKTIEEDWFQQAIRDRDVDLFLVAGHVPLRSEEFTALYRAIREVQWDTPIQFFGGHTHVRDYAKYDSKAYALESGRYMETIGFLSIEGLAVRGKREDSISKSLVKPRNLASQSSPKFSRRYIDNNLYSFHHHSSLDSASFPTPHGRNVSTFIAFARKNLELDNRLGCAPQDLWTNRAPYPSNHSIYTWLQQRVFPEMIYDPDRGARPTMALINTGALRSDVFEGPFTLDTTYTVSPFTNRFRCIQDIPFVIAEKVLVILNTPGTHVAGDSYSLLSKTPVSTKQLKFQRQMLSPRAFFNAEFPRQVSIQKTDAGLTPGYTTVDDAGSDGDDTVHSPLKFYEVPNCVESRINFPSCQVTDEMTAGTSQECESPETVDLVFVDFIQIYVLSVLRFLGTDYQEVDTEAYMNETSLTTLIAGWVKENWDGEC